MARDWREYLRTQEIKTVAIDAIKPYPNNPRDNEKAIPAVAASIERFGFRNPILVDGDGVIIEGHTRRLAALKLGMEEVPVVYATDLTPDEVAALRVIDNKTAELAEWDMDSLAEEMAKLADFDFGEFGFKAGELADMGLEEKDEEYDYEEGADGKPDVAVRTKRGDVWRLGNHVLMCGDSTSEADVARLMGGEKADCLITDPPYNVAIVGCTADKLTIQNDNMGDAQFDEFLRPVFARAAESLKPGAAFYVWHASRTQRAFENAMNAAGMEWREQLVWVKDNFTLGRQDYQWRHEPCAYGWMPGAAHKWVSDRSQTTVLSFPKPTKSELHPCLAPETMVMTDRGYVQIGDVKKGNRVLAADGKFHRVECVTRHGYAEDIYEIRAAGSNLVDGATHNHPYLVARRHTDGKVDVQWVDAVNIRVGDFLMTPQVGFGSEEPMEELDAWCYGLWLAQGSIVRSGNSKTAKYPAFALNAKKPSLREKLIEWGRGVKVSTYKNGDGNGITVMVFDAQRGERCLELCGMHAAHKCISPEVFTWTERLRRAFFEGYMAGDGCVIKTRGHRHSKSVSRALASQIKFLAESLGYKVSIYLRQAPKGTGIGERKFKTTLPYWSSDYKTAKERMWYTRPFTYKGVKYWLRRVVSTTAKKYDAEVVNLTVEGCHTFQTASGMTHNTMKPIMLIRYQMENSTDYGDTVLDLFGGSGTTLIAAERSGRKCRMMELDPKYATVILDRWEAETGKKAELIAEGE